MKNIILKYSFTLGLLLLSLVSCNDYLGGDANIDPTRNKSASLNALLPATIEATSRNNYTFAFSICQITQHLAGAASGGVDIQSEFNLGTAWTGVYLTALSNLNDMVKIAAEQNSPAYVGIGKVLIALNLGTATTAWGDIPYSQAFKLQENLYPSYDSQQSIYQNIQTILDEAIVELAKPIASSVFKPASDDLAFAGNLGRWQKVARALKARYAMHLTKKDGAKIAADKALGFLTAGALSANTEDLQLVYNTRNLNPWHTSVALANNTGNLTVRHSAQLIDAMNGVTWGVVDPRVGIVADNDRTRKGGVTTYSGNVNGAGTGGNCDLSDRSWHSKADSPIVLMSFSEQKLIEAEAEFLSAGGNSKSIGTTSDKAYAAYLAGIRANMDKLGVATTDRDKYLADTKVAVGKDKLTLQLIMNEKFKTMFLNADFWVDMRRYDFSGDVFKDLTLPDKHNPTLNGQWIRRASYPLEEIARNGAEVTKVAKLPADKMWFDQ